MVRAPNIYILAGGGLGDVVRCYLRDEHYWGYLKDLKKKFPRVSIKLLASTHNPQTLEFFKYHPNIDHMHEFGWIVDGYKVVERHKGNYVNIKQAIKAYKNHLTWEQPVCHLSPEDHREAHEILSDGRGLIVMHPFTIRHAMPIEEFIYMTDRLIDDFGYSVAFLGATHNRFHNVNLEPKWTPGLDIPEECDYERPHLYNLLNKSNIRVAYRLVELCHGFIGHCSCFNIAAWIHCRKSVVFSPPCQRPVLTTNRDYAWPLIDRLPWCRNYFNDEWVSPRQVADETVEFFRR